jgi:ketosteroid isomerase-like protein
MTSRQAIMETITRAYKVRDSGDIAGVLQVFHPDARFELAGAKQALEITGAVKGHADIQTAIAGLIAAFEFIKRDIISVIVEGDRAAVHCRVQLRFIPKNHLFVTDLLDVFTVQDGKIVELVEFADTALVKSVIAN